jgi:hypothetical protein
MARTESMIDRFQNGLSVAIAGAGLVLAGLLSTNGWWTWPLILLGAAGMVVGLPVQVAVMVRGARVEAPMLDDNVIDIKRLERAIPAVGPRAGGRSLGLAVLDRSRLGIGQCRITIEKLKCEPDPGWDPNAYPRPRLLWSDGLESDDIPPAGQRTCWIVSATNDLPDDPRGHIGGGFTVVQGLWRIDLVIEAAGYQVRRIVLQFELRKADESSGPEGLLRWQST